MPCEHCAHKREEEFLQYNKFRLEDELRLGVTTAVAGITVSVSGVLRTTDGGAAPFFIQVSPTADRVETVVRQRIGSGWLLHAQADIVAGAEPQRSVWVNARMERPSGATPLPLMQLFSGYVDNDNKPSFPHGRHDSSGEGPGRLRSVTGTDPAAGVEISETVPTGAIWRLLGVRFQLVTDGSAANRRARLVITDGANELHRSAAPSNQTATQTITYSINNNDQAVAVSGQLIPFPTQLAGRIPAGFVIATVTDTFQAGDNYGAPQLWVEEWLVP